MAIIPTQNQYPDRVGYLGLDTNRNVLVGMSDGILQDMTNSTPEGWVNVKDFGAKGDGVTDDTIAIQSAIDYILQITGDSVPSFSNVPPKPVITLFFPFGTYKITDTLILHGTIILDFNNSLINFTPTTSKDFIKTTKNWTNNSSLHNTIKNANIRGNFDKGTGTGFSNICINFKNTGFSKLENINIANFKLALYTGHDPDLQGGYYNISENLTIQHCFQSMSLNNNAFYFTNTIIANGSGDIYEPAANIIINGAGIEFNNLDLEVSPSASNYTAAFDIQSGGLIVNGGYSEGFRYIAMINMSGLYGLPNTIELNFAHKTTQAYKYYNYNQSYQQTVIYSGKINTETSSRLPIIKYNKRTGEGLIPVEVSKTIINNHPHYTAVVGASDPRIYFSFTDSLTEKEFFYKNLYFHVITDAPLETTQYYNQEHQINLNIPIRSVHEFNDITLYDYMLPLNYRIDSGNFMLHLLPDTEVTLYDMYVSESTFMSIDSTQNWETNIPTEGTWKKGDIILNTDVTNKNTYGWICTEGGTPGTWKDFGQVDSSLWENGTSSNRPSSPSVGTRYFDTTLGKPIWFNGTNWVDAAGTIV